MAQVLEEKLESSNSHEQAQNALPPQAVYLLPQILDPAVLDTYAIVHNWIRKLREQHRKAPLIAHNGLYPLLTLAKKLQTSRTVIEQLIELKQLRVQENTYARWKTLEPRSIAELLSAVTKTQLSEILIDDTCYNPEKNIHTPIEHIKRLWNAYEGDRWFETFKSFQQKKITAKTLKLPLLCEWHLIPRASIEKFLQVSQLTTTELNDHGFLIPKEGTFVSRSSYNVVDTKALAQLFALLEDVPLSKKLRYTSIDPTYSRIRANIINKRLIPYLQQKDLAPTKDYTFPEITEITGIDESRLRSWVFTLRAFPSHEVPFQGDRTRAVVKGIDVALRILRGEEKRQMSRKEIAELFGIAENSVDTLRLPPTNDGLYGSQQYVYPLYRMFASDIRARYCRNIADDRNI